MAFNENSRVKLPAILHLCRLGYEYLPLSTATWNTATNIFTDIFKINIQRLNPQMSAVEIDTLLDEINLCLDNEDLGKAFYEKLTATSGPVLLDFENFRNNKLQVVTELPCVKDSEEFRPDITLLINGMPQPL